MPTTKGRFKGTSQCRDLSDQVPHKPERVQLCSLRAAVEKVQQLTISTLKLCSGMGKWPNGNFIMPFGNKVLSHILGTVSGLYW